MAPTPNGRWMRRARILFLLLAVGARATGPLAAQAPVADLLPWSEVIMGTWAGTGDYEGSTLRLERTWTSELGGAFLRADMQVTMAGGGSFGALMYWRIAENGAYEVIWMDGLGRMQRLKATRDPASGVVATTYLDELTGDGAEWRTWEFEIQGPDAYVERLYRQMGDDRELLTTFRFSRR